MTDTPTPTPRPTLLRLPQYHRVLKEMARDEGREHVSCTQIAYRLRLEPTQVRKDLAATGIVGRPRIGYDTARLIEAIETFLGWKNTSDAFLIGAGNLGTALMGYEGFREHGLNIVAAFDTDPEKIGAEIVGRPVFGLEKLPDLADRLHVKIAIITAPAEAARQVAELAVVSGIRALWNFAPVYLDVPEDVVVEDVRLVASLGALTGKLNQRIRSEDFAREST